jgi:hypothetical protein
MLSAAAICVTVRPSLKSFTASSFLSRANGIRPDRVLGFRLGNPLSPLLEHHLALELSEGARELGHETASRSVTSAALS